MPKEINLFHSKNQIVSNTHTFKYILLLLIIHKVCVCMRVFNQHKWNLLSDTYFDTYDLINIVYLLFVFLFKNKINFVSFQRNPNFYLHFFDIIFVRLRLIFSKQQSIIAAQYIYVKFSMKNVLKPPNESNVILF